MGHHQPGSGECLLSQGHLEQAVHAQGDVRPSRAPCIHPLAQALVSLPRKAIAFTPWSVHGGHRELSLYRRHTHQSIGHRFTRSCTVLVSHHDALDMGRQCAEVFESIGVAHPDQRDATRIHALLRQGLDKGRHPFSLQPKIPRGAMAHFRGRHHDVVCSAQSVPDRLPAESASVFAQHMTLHMPCVAQVRTQLGFEWGARGFVVGEVEHGEAT